MKFVVCAFVLLLTSISFSQDYVQVDHKVKNYPQFSSIDHLSIRIKNDFESNMDRVRAAFTWITANIHYDESLDTSFAPKPQIIHYSDEGRKFLLRKNDSKKVEKAFQTKKGRCKEFSLLFHKLCLEFGIDSEIIYGIAKIEIRDIKDERLFKNHAWNAVMLDGEWKLIDTTWASAYMSSSSHKHTPEGAEHYFLTEPSAFIKSHYPANPDWPLLSPLVDVGSFYSAPIFYTGYFVKDVTLKSNTDGYLRLSDDNKFLIQFENLPRKRAMQYWVSETSELRKIRLKKTENNEYVIESKLSKKLQEKENLVLIYGNEPILSFKIRKIPNYSENP